MDVIIIHVKIQVSGSHFHRTESQGRKQLEYNQCVFWEVVVSETLTLHYIPNRQDYASVLRIFFWQRTGTRVSLGLLAIAFGLILYMIISQDSPPSIIEILWLLLPPFFVTFVFIIQPSRLSNRAIQNEQLAAEVTWELNEAGVLISNRFGSTLMEWDALQRMLSTRKYYLLLSKKNKNTFRFLPCRAFDSQQQEDQFLALARKYLPAR